MIDWQMLAPHVAWLAAGVLLCIAELLVPGVFLLWLGIAALLTGLIAWLLPVGTGVQLGIFAVLAVASVYIGRRWSAGAAIPSSDPLLNDRIGRLVGEVVPVSTAISAGVGRVHVGDSEWSARGPDCAAGTLVRITGAHQGDLLVELT